MLNVRPFTWLGLSFFGYYCAYGVYLPLFPAWLKHQDYSPENIGFMLALAYVFRFLGGIIFSGRIKKAADLVYSLRYLALASLILTLFIGLMAQHFWLLLVALMLFSMVNAAGMPISDSLAATWQQQIKLDYGKARLIGSLAFVIAVVCFGALINYLGASAIIWAIAALFGLYSLCQLLTPKPMPVDDSQGVQQASVSYRELLKNTTTWRLLVAIALIQGAHAAYYAYSVLYWTAQGISVSITGILWGVGVLAEIGVFYFSGRFFKNWSVSALFFLTGIASLVRWGAFPYTENLVAIALLQCLHGLTYVAGHYATVRYITTQPQSHIAKLQGLYNALAGCAAMALLTALSGVLYPLSPHYAFMAMVLATLLGMLFIPRKVNAFLLHEVK